MICSEPDCLNFRLKKGIYCKEHRDIHDPPRKKYSELSEFQKERLRQRQKDRYKILNSSIEGKALLAKYRLKGHLKFSYGLSKEEYFKILNNQNGVCAICNNKPNERLSVDHCHKTKKIRGLLCRKCNAGVGFFKDDINHLQKAIEYLKLYNGVEYAE